MEQAFGYRLRTGASGIWVPAFAGMTDRLIGRRIPLLRPSGHRLRRIQIGFMELFTAPIEEGVRRAETTISTDMHAARAAIF